LVINNPEHGIRKRKNLGQTREKKNEQKKSTKKDYWV